MDDNEIVAFETEPIERPITKRLASTRRPGGPRQAFRPVHNHIHLRTASHGTTTSVDAPEDITDEEGLYEPNSKSNPTLAEMSIDPACLDALDDQLLSSPIDSFADVCWADAVEELESESDRDSPTLYNAPISTSQQHLNSDHTDPDVLISGKANWFADESEVKVHRTEVIYEKEPPAYFSPPPSTGIEPLLGLWQPHFPARNPNDTVHGFPSRPHHKSRRWKRFDVLTNACSHLPGCLVKSAT